MKKKIVYLICAGFGVGFMQSLFAGDIELAKLPSKSIYNSNTNWKNQNSVAVRLVSFRGTPVVASMIYTSCKASCPLLMNDLKSIESKIPVSKRDKVRFVVFAFDSKGDSPQTLSDFAKKYHVDTSRWSFLHGSLDSIREIAALLNIRFKPIEGGGIEHSNVISVLNPEGEIIHQQNGLRQDPSATLQVLADISNSQ